MFLLDNTHPNYNADDSAKITHWRCPNCGQTFFAASIDELPANCAICHQPIAWQQLGAIKRWRCPNCGQTFFAGADDKPPDMCHYCDDFTTWKRVYD
jgi:predicted RNA-binding Zn-ribbon protein involved in translation (DUF1610 family)